MKPGEVMREALFGAAISIGLGPAYSSPDAPPAFFGALHGQPDADAEVSARAQAEVPALPAAEFIEVNREKLRALGLKNQAELGKRGGIWVNTRGYELYDVTKRLKDVAEGLASIALMRATWHS